MMQNQIHFDGGAIFGVKGNHYTKDGHCYLTKFNDETKKSDIIWCYLSDEDFIEAMKWSN
jgi:hypothetical protein